MPGVLEAFTRLRAPATGWKLVVVDNGSTDKTREIVISFQARLPLSYLFEERAGKNVALNRGLSLLEGDLAVFTDDDAFPHPDWLLALRGSADSQSSYAMFGGVIVPRFEREPPYWLAWAPPGPCFSVSNPLMAEGPTEPCNLFGPNMAIRADVFRNGTRFDPSLGPGTGCSLGDETELVQRVARQGHKALARPGRSRRAFCALPTDAQALGL